MIRPSLRQLSYLIAIEEQGSFVAAAEHCGVTQSTLSAGIKELETILEQQLVIRGKKQARLHPFGIEVVEQSRKILMDTDRIVLRSKHLLEPMSGPLRLGMIPTISPYMLPSLLPKLTQKFPNLEVQIFEDLTEKLLEMLQASQIDVALMAFPYETPGMTQFMLFEEPFFAALPSNFDFNDDTIKISELRPDRLLLLEDGHCMRDHALSACDLQLPRQRKTFSATSLPTVIQMVRAGYGMTLLPEMACRDGNLPADIRLVPFAGTDIPSRVIGLSWRVNDPRREDYETLARGLL